VSKIRLQLRSALAVPKLGCCRQHYRCTQAVSESP
jgi:hypothetical protein